MALKTLVKVNAVNNLSDARYCAGMGVSMMGFAIDSDDVHHVNPEQFKAITQWIKGVALIGELHTTDLAIIHHTLEQYTLDGLQFDHPIALQSMARLEIPVLLKIDLRGNEEFTSLQALMNTYAPYVKYFLLEATSVQEAAITFLQPMIHHLANRFPILQGFDVSAATLPHLLSTKIQGIALQRGVKTQLGYKNFDALADILECLAVE
jgi:phosphoribosylanthranilate isomerase